MTHNRPTIISSHDLLKRAPMAATALVVAESKCEDRRVPARRVALEWISGLRNDAALLQTAAEKLPETTALAKTAQQHDSDGSPCLKSDPRCNIRWTVRIIALSLIRCWAGFEDATGTTPANDQPVKDTEPQEPKQDIQQSTPTPVPMPKTSLPKSQTQVSQPSALPASKTQFAPMEALILNPKAGFTGNCCKPEGKYVSDGRMLLLRSACCNTFLDKLKPGASGPYGPKNPLPDERAAEVLKHAAKDAIFTSTIRGFVLAKQLGISEGSDRPYACIVCQTGAFVVVDGHRLQFAMNVTGADQVKVADEKRPIVLFKGSEPVGVLITIFDPTINKAFKAMLEPSPCPLQVTPERQSRQRMAS